MGAGQGSDLRVIRPGDRVRCLNRQSYRLGQVGTVVEVVEAPAWRWEGGLKVLVSGSPDLKGPSFAWVLYEDGIRTPHDLTNLERLEGP